MTRAAGGLIDVADVGTDTGWIACVLAAGITNIASYPLSYRRMNGLVFISGRVTGLTAATNVQLTNSTGGALPVGYRPLVPIWDLGIIANGTSTKARVWVSSTGHISARTDSGLDAWAFGVFPADA